MAKVGDETYDGVKILIQHLAMKVPDRAEFRHKGSLAIITLMLGLPHNHFAEITSWFFRMAYADKSANRQFAIEVMGRLLAENEREKPRYFKENFNYSNDHICYMHRKFSRLEHDYGFAPVEPPPEDPGQKSSEGYFSSHKFLFGMIFSRCKDNSALVRAKALSTLADVTSKAHENDVIADIIKALFDPSLNDANAKRTVDFLELLQNLEDSDLSKVNPLPKSEDLIDFLRKRALDDSVFVRKHALAVLENILR